MCVACVVWVWWSVYSMNGVCVVCMVWWSVYGVCVMSVGCTWYVQCICCEYGVWCGGGAYAVTECV